MADCVDDDGTLRACSDYFADQGEGVELIDPERRPTSFRVTTSNPGDVGELVTGLAGLDGVENTG
ncbi:MAG: hypothetical protein AAFN30_14855 [Actinomycetota bacterium]